MNKDNLVKLGVHIINQPHKVQHYAKGKDSNEVMRNAFYKILEMEEGERITSYTLPKKMEEHGRQVFAIIEEVLQETFLNGVYEDELFQEYADVRNLRLGDTARFTVKDKGASVVSRVSEGNWDIHRQALTQGESIDVSTDEYGAQLYSDFYNFLTGVYTFEELIEGVSDAFLGKLNELIAGAFGNASKVLPPEFTATGTFDLETLQTIADHVEAANGTTSVVIGTRTALSKIADSAKIEWITDVQKANRQNTGAIGIYEGMQLIQLPRVHKRGTLNFAYDDKKLLVLPAGADIKPIKVVVEGDGMVRNVNSPETFQDQTGNYAFVTRFGVEVVFDGAFGIMNIVD